MAGQLTVSAFNWPGQYASSAGNRAYCYALAVFLPSGDRTIASTHFAYPRRDSQAELAWVVDQIQRRCERDSNPRAVSHPSTNRARRKVSSLIETNHDWEERATIALNSHPGQNG